MLKLQMQHVSYDDRIDAVTKNCIIPFQLHRYAVLVASYCEFGTEHFNFFPGTRGIKDFGTPKSLSRSN